MVLVAALRNTEKNMAELTTGDIGLIQNLGKELFTNFVVPFEISSILFLSAMVGAVVLGKRDETGPVDEEVKKIKDVQKQMNVPAES